MAKTINDPNINQAMEMSAEQLKQIKKIQRQVQASRKKRSERSGGSAEGHDHDHDHEEEDPRTAPGDPGDHYSSGISG
jgi:ABC-type Zn2+ transport system substrate-binding protein/surface adhesin